MSDETERGSVYADIANSDRLRMVLVDLCRDYRLVPQPGADPAAVWVAMGAQAKSKAVLDILAEHDEEAFLKVILDIQRGRQWPKGKRKTQGRKPPPTAETGDPDPTT